MTDAETIGTYLYALAHDQPLQLKSVSASWLQRTASVAVLVAGNQIRLGSACDGLSLRDFQQEVIHACNDAWRLPYKATTAVATAMETQPFAMRALQFPLHELTRCEAHVCCTLWAFCSLRHVITLLLACVG
jgi:hypothetical protein